MKNFIIIFSSVLMICSCTKVSEVTKVSEGVYSVTAKAPGSGGGLIGAKKSAYKIADSFCRKNFKRKATILDVTFEDDQYFPRESAASISFGCVDDGDPLLMKNDSFIYQKKNEKLSKEELVEENEMAEEEPDTELEVLPEKAPETPSQEDEIDPALQKTE